MQKIIQQAPKSILKSMPNALDHLVIYESATEYATRAQDLRNQNKLQSANHADMNWTGGIDCQGTINGIVNGNLEGVEASDKLLLQFEDLLRLETSKFKTFPAMAGGFANVPAYLAGQPMAMRNRKRVAQDMAPLTIVVDTTSSAAITADHLKKRGACILALVRVLSAARPVSLYTTISIGADQKPTCSFHSYVPVETTPLDLARANILIAHPCFSRALAYWTTEVEFKVDSGGSIPWAYNNQELSRSADLEIAQSIFGGEVLNIPAMNYQDESIHNPEAWLKKYLGQYGGNLIDQDAA